MVELPESRPVVIEAWTYAARCAACGERTLGEAPAGLEATRTFGPRGEALLGYLPAPRPPPLAQAAGRRLRERVRAPDQRGRVAAALARLATRAGPEMAAIREAVRASPAINSDETCVRVDDRNWWHWVFQVPTASYHVIAPSRGADVVLGFLGHARPEAWGSDAFPT